MSPRRALAALALVATGFAFSPPANALPLYAQRSGRTCGNCHVSPTWEDEAGWDNPELPWRKCTMSCVGCHVDPAGGGLRTVSGRYYGQSTLSMIHTQERSYSDLGRELIGQTALYRMQRLVNKGPTKNADGRFIPSSWEEVQEGIGHGQRGGWSSGGRLAAQRMAWWDGRYGNLNADPVFQIGGDMRGAYWSGSGTAFPMQAEISAGFHPAHHVTAVVSAAARGQTTGQLATEPDAPLYPRRAFLMTHEWPMMAWAKAGIFQPSFGNYADDHTSPVRSLFELSTSSSDDTVAGVEVGMAPNYPFVAASVFQNDTSPIAGGQRDTGWGSALHGGWRDLGWSVTGHGQLRQRGGKGRGDLLAGGVGVGFNPMHYFPQLPLTWLGELTLGQRTFGTERTGLGAAQSELALLLWNGVQVQVHHDVVVAELGSPVQVRHQLGGEICPLPGLTFEAAVRALQSPGSHTGVDVFLTNHLWF